MRICRTQTSEEEQGSSSQAARCAFALEVGHAASETIAAAGRDAVKSVGKKLADQHSSLYKYPSGSLSQLMSDTQAKEKYG
jgi:hypothetical protein